VLTLLLSSVAFASCSFASNKSDFAGPDWSRGRLLGKTIINNRPAIAWDPETKSAILAWLTKVQDQQCFQWVRIDAQGQTVDSRLLVLSLYQASYPQLLRDSRRGFHLFWMDGENNEHTMLYRVPVSTDGRALSEPQKLTAWESDVSGYAVVEAQPGFLDVVYSDATPSSPLLYHARLTTTGKIVVPFHPLNVSGQHPACAVDHDGTIHLTWHKLEAMTGEQILYATFDSRSLALNGPVVIATSPRGTGLVLYPPEIGLDLNNIYVLWSLERRAGGYSAGSAQTYFETFPIGNPSAHMGSTLEIPANVQPDYVFCTGAFNYKVLAYLEDQSRVGGIVKEEKRTHVFPPHQFEPKTVPVGVEDTYMPYVIPGQRAEAGIIVSSLMAIPKRPGEGQVQIVFCVMKDGQWKGLQLAGITRSASMRPIAVADDQGAIHLAWLDAGGFGVYEVYYASTSPSVRAALNRITPQDVLLSLMSKTWNAAAALSFFPVLVIWLFLPALWLFVFSVMRPDCDLRTRSGQIGLAIAMLLYLASKLLLVPSFLQYAPFLDVVPTKFQGWIIYGLPVLIAAIGLLAMAAYAWRSDHKMVLAAFAIFAAVDLILSLILYIPNVIG